MGTARVDDVGGAPAEGAAEGATKGAAGIAAVGAAGGAVTGVRCSSPILSIRRSHDELDPVQLAPYCRDVTAPEPYITSGGPSKTRGCCGAHSSMFASDVIPQAALLPLSPSQLGKKGGSRSFKENSPVRLEVSIGPKGPLSPSLPSMLQAQMESFSFAVVADPSTDCPGLQLHSTMPAGTRLVQLAPHLSTAQHCKGPISAPVLCKSAESTSTRCTCATASLSQAGIPCQARHAGWPASSHSGPQSVLKDATEGSVLQQNPMTHQPRGFCKATSCPQEVEGEREREPHCVVSVLSLNGLAAQSIVFDQHAPGRQPVQPVHLSQPSHRHLPNKPGKPLQSGEPGQSERYSRTYPLSLASGAFPPCGSHIPTLYLSPGDLSEASNLEHPHNGASEIEKSSEPPEGAPAGPECMHRRSADILPRWCFLAPSGISASHFCRPDPHAGTPVVYPKAPNEGSPRPRPVHPEADEAPEGSSKSNSGRHGGSHNLPGSKRACSGSPQTCAPGAYPVTPYGGGSCPGVEKPPESGEGQLWSTSPLSTGHHSGEGRCQGMPGGYEEGSTPFFSDEGSCRTPAKAATPMASRGKQSTPNATRSPLARALSRASTWHESRAPAKDCPKAYPATASPLSSASPAVLKDSWRHWPGPKEEDGATCQRGSAQIEKSPTSSPRVPKSPMGNGHVHRALRVLRNWSSLKDKDADTCQQQSDLPESHPNLASPHVHPGSPRSKNQRPRTIQKWSSDSNSLTKQVGQEASKNQGTANAFTSTGAVREKKGSALHRWQSPGSSSALGRGVSPVAQSTPALGGKHLLQKVVRAGRRALYSSSEARQHQSPLGGVSEAVEAGFEGSLVWAAAGVKQAMKDRRRVNEEAEAQQQGSPVAASQRGVATSTMTVGISRGSPSHEGKDGDEGDSFVFTFHRRAESVCVDVRSVDSPKEPATQQPQGTATCSTQRAKAGSGCMDVRSSGVLRELAAQQLQGSPSLTTWRTKAEPLTRPQITREPSVDAAVCEKFSLSQLAEATNSWSQANIIGRGSYGTVFRGVLEEEQVAIKRLDRAGHHGQQEYSTEIRVLSAVCHRNIVRLIGHCPDNHCLVYEYIPRGSLQDWLCQEEKRACLSWAMRIRIMIGLGSALVALHTSQPPLVHRDLKPENVLLDDNLDAKLADVGLARRFREGGDDWSYSVSGTFGYMDPEGIRTFEISPLGDVYAFGLILLQVLMGEARISTVHNLLDTLAGKDRDDLSQRRGAAVEIARHADVLAGAWPSDVACHLASLALTCVQRQRLLRPSLAHTVLPHLERLARMRAGQPTERGAF